MAAPLDVLLRPTKFVMSKGGVFVALSFVITEEAGINGLILRNEMDGEESDWQEAATITDEANNVFLFCGAYGDVGATDEFRGTPTFVAAGQIYNPETGRSLELIVASNDGITWSQVRKGPATEVYAMGWDDTGKKFYAQTFDLVLDEAGHAGDEQIIRVLESADGFSWSENEQRPTPINGPIWASDQLQATGTESFMDVSGTDHSENTAPNGGLYGWDKDQDILIGPKVITGKYEWTSVTWEPHDPAPGTEVEVIDGATSTTVSLPMDHVLCVAQANGIWQAGGYNGDGEAGIIASSVDDGETWQEVYSGERSVFCMMGAPRDMFESSSRSARRRR